jgi:hypothetical protein
MTPRACIATAAAIACLLPVMSACTGTRIREFTRESYEPPEFAVPSARVFAAPSERVFDLLLELLERRAARVEDADPGARRLLAAMRWASADEAVASVALGRVRRVVTSAKRTYRSYSPLDFRCNACVVRNGKLTAEETRLVEDVTIQLPHASYRLEALLDARLESVRGGTRVELALEIVAAPPEPSRLAPQSTGQLEASILATLEEGLR